MRTPQDFLFPQRRGFSGGKFALQGMWTLHRAKLLRNCVAGDAQRRGEPPRLRFYLCGKRKGNSEVLSVEALSRTTSGKRGSPSCTEGREFWKGSGGFARLELWVFRVPSRALLRAFRGLSQTGKSRLYRGYGLKTTEHEDLGGDCFRTERGSRSCCGHILWGGERGHKIKTPETPWTVPGLGWCLLVSIFLV